MSMSKVSAADISTSTRSKSFSTPAHSPQLLTPISTPPQPSFAEQRLQQMLRNCEAGTHSFHRDDEDDYVPSGSSGVRQAQVQGQGQVNDMRRKSFAGGEAIGGQGQRSGRRPSFLSSLSLSRPFAFTPSQPSSPATQPSHHHHLPSGLSMTTSSPNSIASSPVTTGREIDRAQSTPPHLQQQVQPQPTPLQSQSKSKSDNEVAAAAMQRSKTQPNPPVKVSGFSAGFGFGMTASVQPLEERRHFDPGREPKLLGLL